MEVRSFVASFFLAKWKQLIDIPVCMVEANMIDPAVLTEPMPAGIIIKVCLSQANSTLSHKSGDLVIFLVFDNIPSSLFLIEQIVKIVRIEVREIVQHKCPSIRHGTEHGFHRDLFPNFLKKLIEMIDGVRTIFRENILNGETINLILILLLVLIILLLIVLLLIALLHFILLRHFKWLSLSIKPIINLFFDAARQSHIELIKLFTTNRTLSRGGRVKMERKGYLCWKIGQVKLQSQLYSMFLGVRALNLLRAVPKMTLFTVPRAPFSQFFDKQDEGELKNAFESQYKKKFLHFKLTDQWQKPLQRKARRKERKIEIAKAKVQPKNDIEKLVVHNPAVGIEYPAKPTETFAVIQVDGFQYKVVEDATLILDTKQEHQINKPIFFKQVPLIGTKSYTLIGRPTIGEAYVEAMVESISSSKKVIVFKKKRRKNYKRSFGSRVSLTQIRITKIFHTLKEEVLSKAIALQ